MLLYAITLPTPTSGAPYPAFINATRKGDGTVEVMVRTQHDQDASTIRLTPEQARELGAALLGSERPAGLPPGGARPI